MRGKKSTEQAEKQPHDCTTCAYYRENKKGARVYSDKTVEPGGQVTKRWCSHGDFEMTDVEPCGLYRKRSGKIIMPISSPPQGGSGIPPRRNIWMKFTDEMNITVMVNGDSLINKNKAVIEKLENLIVSLKYGGIYPTKIKTIPYSKPACVLLVTFKWVT
jgi:hypothetical protein